MRIFILLIWIIIAAGACSKDETDDSKNSDQLIGQLEGTWEYFRGIELRCNSLDEIGDFDIEEYNRNTWKSDGSFYREYTEDDGSTNSHTGKWTLLGKEGEAYIYKTVINGISGSDTTYILFKDNILLNYDKDCFSVPYDPFNIREAGEARRVD